MIKKYIMTPGPTPISEEVLLEHARPLMHHRSPEFSKIFMAVTEKLKKLFRTKNDIFVLTSSGTGGMEAAVTNSFSRGDKVLVASAGNFGERFKKISKKFGLEVISLDYEWGDAVDPADIKKALDKDSDIKGVMLQFSETSTGALNDIEAIGKIVKNYPAILIIDAISGLGASDLRTDEWDLDIVVGGSQKALSAPTGVAFISISDKAWKLIKESDLPRFYFDLSTAKDYILKSPPQTPWTPGISIIVALNKALDMLLDEGLDKLFERHRIMALAVQRAVEKMGLRLLVEDEGKRGFSVTSVRVPDGIDAKELTRIMRVKYGVTIAGGQGKLAGKIIRIGHLGYFGIFDIIIAISALEIALNEMGYKVEIGSGITEAEKVFIENNYLDE
jgi:aspartate aminotransferase-like enzyme